MIGTCAIGAAPPAGGAEAVVAAAPVPAAALVSRPGGRGGRSLPDRPEGVRARPSGEGARPERP